MREIPISGVVRRKEQGEWTDDQKVAHPSGKITVVNEYDKVEVKLDWQSSDRVIDSFTKVQEGERVTLLVGVSSGANKDQDPKFQFLDDLTPRGAAGSGKS